MEEQVRGDLLFRLIWGILVRVGLWRKSGEDDSIFLNFGAFISGIWAHTKKVSCKTADFDEKQGQTERFFYMDTFRQKNDEKHV